jgi:hypothetical protein
MPLRDAGYRRTTPDVAMGRFVQVPLRHISDHVSLGQSSYLSVYLSVDQGRFGFVGLPRNELGGGVVGAVGPLIADSLVTGRMSPDQTR